jgi:hypothetical protein
MASFMRKPLAIPADAISTLCKDMCTRSDEAIMTQGAVRGYRRVHNDAAGLAANDSRGEAIWEGSLRRRRFGAPELL